MLQRTAAADTTDAIRTEMLARGCDAIRRGGGKGHDRALVFHLRDRDRFAGQREGHEDRTVGAMRHAVAAGRQAFLAGRMDAVPYRAVASSPQVGLITQWPAISHSSSSRFPS